MAKRRKNKRINRHKEFLQTLSFFLVTIFSIGGLIIYLWVYTEIDETLMAIEIQKSTFSELNNSVKELKSDISRLNRVDRITAVARKELGMVVAKPEPIIILVDPVLVENSFD
ncbi:MAG: septum formation initiator family protein [Candidatus Marinimicrobia bacterium]|jgi:cell division protein FtsB|nr:hypothetical protein [Candidatus Neomarinimicrobiota bacterium]MDP5957702.1 septum formation initiator family protein [Candidatus Neomarinimicrobiota bacterium]MDP6229612.1 septum formation initiator family protein [Candidatus Neomarinimicrobiota bacterium]MDP7095614.1 septum formation initiator family protein [Candidatus Neomarinimicrobiota bacterium]MDP7165193.1 septum formation initiator family protein [Candidatus Neomarinimicrobiota bacterium]|tara:strand:+ start:643 stop:981 length:339 start_codon:yes stop_codon:yes gene_type:complete